MDYNTFYIYNEIISNNKYLYKKLWSINKNEDRNKFINAIYRQIFKAKIRDKFITNWRIGMPDIKKIYYCTCYYNYYNYTLDIFIHSNKQDVTVYNLVKKINIHDTNNLMLYNELAKYCDNYELVLNIHNNTKKIYVEFFNYLYFFLKMNNIPKDIINLIKNYLN